MNYVGLLYDPRDTVRISEELDISGLDDLTACRLYVFVIRLMDIYSSHLFRDSMPGGARSLAEDILELRTHASNMNESIQSRNSTDAIINRLRELIAYINRSSSIILNKLDAGLPGAEIPNHAFVFRDLKNFLTSNTDFSIRHVRLIEDRGIPWVDLLPELATDFTPPEFPNWAKRDSVIVTTGDKTIRRINLGSFIISFNPRVIMYDRNTNNRLSSLGLCKSGLCILKYRHNRFANNYYHPHVTPEGNICTGNGTAAIESAFRAGSISDVFTVTDVILSNYGSNPFIPIDRWSDAARCPVCGDYITEADVSVRCPVTNAEIHRGCSVVIDGTAYSTAVTSECTCCCRLKLVSQLTSGRCEECEQLYNRQQAAMFNGDFLCPLCNRTLLEADIGANSIINIPGSPTSVCSNCVELLSDNRVRFREDTTNEIVPIARFPVVLKALRANTGITYTLQERCPTCTARGGNIRPSIMGIPVCNACDPEGLGLDLVTLDSPDLLDAYVDTFINSNVDSFTVSYTVRHRFVEDGTPIATAVDVVKRLRRLELITSVRPHSLMNIKIHPKLNFINNTVLGGIFNLFTLADESMGEIHDQEQQIWCSNNGGRQIGGDEARNFFNSIPTRVPEPGDGHGHPEGAYAEEDGEHGGDEDGGYEGEEREEGEEE